MEICFLRARRFLRRLRYVDDYAFRLSHHADLNPLGRGKRHRDIGFSKEQQQQQPVAFALGGEEEFLYITEDVLLDVIEKPCRTNANDIYHV
jgi:hypothetical protein